MHNETVNPGYCTATIGGGCFWCLDAVFRQIQGVHSVASGFAGGDAATANYQQACSGLTEHIEVVQIRFDEAVLPYEQLLAIFFAAHDPTQINRQNYDVGPQYRSVIFSHGQKQHNTAQLMIDTMDNEGLFEQKIATELRPSMPFYPAPEQHQNFYQSNPNQRYCQIIIWPKLEKIRQLFAERLV